LHDAAQVRGCVRCRADGVDLQGWWPEGPAIRPGQGSECRGIRPFWKAVWVLADAEGNEACVCTWTDRDEREH
jgi:hypothetical protein